MIEFWGADGYVRRLAMKKNDDLCLMPRRSVRRSRPVGGSVPARAQCGSLWRSGWFTGETGSRERYLRRTSL